MSFALTRFEGGTLHCLLVCGRNYFWTCREVAHVLDNNRHSVILYVASYSAHAVCDASMIACAT